MQHNMDDKMTEVPQSYHTVQKNPTIHIIRLRRNSFFMKNLQNYKNRLCDENTVCFWLNLASSMVYKTVVT